MESWYHLQLFFKSAVYGIKQMELNPIYNRIEDYQARSEVLRGYL